MVLRRSVLIFVLISSIYGDVKGDVDLDYFYGSSLRTDVTIKCNSRLKQFICQIRCNLRPALCIDDTCYCMTIAPPNINKPEVTSKILPSNNNSKRKKTVENLEHLKTPEIESVINHALRPTVRHHIAHFCPNLEDARSCIRKCMEQGKPAFCGKDHVCYCGHKYSHTGKDDGGDTEQIYAQFKDLYEKYFGPDYKGNIEG